jgi:hypothetical protein
MYVHCEYIVHKACAVCRVIDLLLILWDPEDIVRAYFCLKKITDNISKYVI